jgi:hypothetical protein
MLLSVPHSVSLKNRITGILTLMKKFSRESFVRTLYSVRISVSVETGLFFSETNYAVSVQLKSGLRLCNDERQKILRSIRGEKDIVSVCAWRTKVILVRQPARLL